MKIKNKKFISEIILKLPKFIIKFLFKFSSIIFFYENYEYIKKIIDQNTFESFINYIIYRIKKVK